MCFSVFSVSEGEKPLEELSQHSILEMKRQQTIRRHSQNFPEASFNNISELTQALSACLVDDLHPRLFPLEVKCMF